MALRLREALEGAGAEIAVVGSETLASATSDLYLADPQPDRGPLGGLYAALEWAISRSRSGVLCVACDMPFLSSPLLRYLIQKGESGRADVVLPRVGRPPRIQPLSAWYSVSCLPAVKSRLSTESVSASIKDLLPELSVQEIDDSDLTLFGDPRTLFMNVNTPEDLAGAEALVGLS